MAPLVTWAWARGESRVGQARAAARSCGQAVSTAHRGAHARHAAEYAAIAEERPSKRGSDAAALERACATSGCVGRRSE
jgi:hypothetical protein